MEKWHREERSEYHTLIYKVDGTKAGHLILCYEIMYCGSLEKELDGGVRELVLQREHS